MLIFNCTKAAAEFFTRNSKGEKISPIEPAEHKTIAEALQAEQEKPENDYAHNWHWLVHVVTVKRKKALIVIDYHSRFSMTFTGLKKGDELAFLNMFDHHLSVHSQLLLEEVIEDEQTLTDCLDCYNFTHTNCAFHQRGDRSVQATINDIAFNFECFAYDTGYVPEEFDLINFDASINQLLRKAKNSKNYFSPHHVFINNWLSDYSDFTPQEIAAKISKYQQDEIAFRKELFNSDDIDLKEIFSEEKDTNNDNVFNLDDFRKKPNNSK